MDVSKHEENEHEDTPEAPADAVAPAALPKVTQQDLGELRFLGAGEFCTVSATTLKGELVAIKVLKDSQRQNAIAQRDLAQEIALMAKMSHKNVLRPLAQGQFADSPLLVLPIIGQMLSNELPKPAGSVPIWTRRAQIKRWPLSRALKCGVELAEALHYCHCEAQSDYRILHRDIKPNNIGFLSDGRLVLFDFGLAKLWKIDGDDTCTRWLTGQTGSLRYMAPEVALSQPYNHKAEIFSFATCLWQMASHDVPYYEFDCEAFLDRVCHKGERLKPKKDWPQELTKLLADCWRPEHNTRPDLAEVLPVLRKLHKDVLATEPNSRPGTA